MKRKGLMLLCGVLWLIGGDPAWAQAPITCGIDEEPQKESAMFDDRLDSPAAEIPPIDRKAPAVFETASFGLG